MRLFEGGGKTLGAIVPDVGEQGLAPNRAWIRLVTHPPQVKLHESPIFQKMKAEGKGSKSPLTDSFFKYPNNKFVLLALLGATAGQGVVWYTGQFYALFFLVITLKLDYVSTYMLIGLSLLIGTPFFIVFGWLSDKIGRLKIIMAGCLIAAVTYFPLFGALTHYVNPALEEFAAKTPITVAASECNFHLFVGPWSKFSDCDKAKDYLTKQGLSFKSVPTEPGKAVVTMIGSTRIEGWDQKQLDSEERIRQRPGSLRPVITLRARFTYSGRADGVFGMYGSGCMSHHNTASGSSRSPNRAGRMECAQLAAAVERPAQPESASKLDALHTLREIRAS